VDAGAVDTWDSGFSTFGWTPIGGFPAPSGPAAFADVLVSAAASLLISPLGPGGDDDGVSLCPAFAETADMPDCTVRIVALGAPPNSGGVAISGDMMLLLATGLFTSAVEPGGGIENVAFCSGFTAVDFSGEATSAINGCGGAATSEGKVK
jgi:hypothetical protein